MTKKSKKAIIALSILLAFLIGLGIFLCVWFFGAKYPAFDHLAQREEALPALTDGFCPQGACALPRNDGGYTAAVSGYYKPGVPSRVYLLGEGKEPAFVTVEKDGKLLDAHFGGVAATEKYLYITNDTEIVRLALEDVYEAAGAGGKAAVIDSFETGIPEIAFCAVSGDLFFVGEFYRKGNYETDKTHHVTQNGETNRALVYCYKMNEDNPHGMASITTPYAVLSVRGLVQGIAVREDYIVLSCSWGLADSKLYWYSNPLGGASEFSSTPRFFLGEDSLLGTLTAPCMSEGIFVREDRVNILFESGANKYKHFVRRRTTALYSVPLSAYEK